MANVTELGYIGIAVSDPDAWKTYAGEVVGLEVVDEGEHDRFYLRMDYWHHRIVVHTGPEDDISYLGWRVVDAEALAEMALKLQSAGIAFTVGSAEEAQERRVVGLLKLADPGGNPTEIFHGPQVDTYRPFHPGRPMHGRFVTGEQGLGHIVLRQHDDAAALNFYRVLGFRGGLEYRLPGPDGETMDLIFMHCNARHHSVAFGLGAIPKRANHLMLEYTDLNDLGFAHDTVRRRQIDVALQLGKHANDQALTFYCANPSGWLWELGWGGRQPSHQQELYRADIFGHGPEAGGHGLDMDLELKT